MPEGSDTLAVQLLPAQIEAGKGTAIFTGATASLRGGPKFALLAAPKFALRALAQSAAREFQSKVRLSSQPPAAPLACLFELEEKLTASL